MTQGTNPQDPIDRLANIVERFIEVSSRRMDQMEQAVLRTQERQDQLEWNGIDGDLRGCSP